MPVKTVRWLELVFGDGVSADEATRKILEEMDTETALDETTTDEESDSEEPVDGSEEAPEESDSEESVDASEEAPDESDDEAQ
jgi:large subunit ribosomal protein L4